MLKILVHSSFIDFTHVEGAPDITQINVIVFAIIGEAFAAFPKKSDKCQGGGGHD